VLQKHFSRSALLIVSLSLVACGNDAEDADAENESTNYVTAATLGEQEILSTSAYLQQEHYSAASRRNGATQAQICKACHSVDAGGPNMIGPALFGMFGRGVGDQPGFDYSPVLRNADFVWTPRALNAWLAQPGRFLPGNRMIFTGVFRQSDRDDLIAYLLETTVDDGGEK